MRLLAILTICAATIAMPVFANPFERATPVTDPLVNKECGEWHMAFQPGLLPAPSWNRIMANLNDHFGDRATLPPDQVKAITAYLTTKAGRGDPSINRITEQSWWRREHRMADAEWRKPTVRSKSNCAACHAGANAGRYEND